MKELPQWSLDFFLWAIFFPLLGQQSESSPEQIRNTSVKNKEAGKKRGKILRIQMRLYYFLPPFPVNIFTPLEQNLLCDHSDIGLWMHLPPLEQKLDSEICSFFQRCRLPVVWGMKQYEKTNNPEVLLLWPLWGHSYLTKGYTLLYAVEKASLSNRSPEQWGPASGKQGHLHAAVCRFPDHKGQSKDP